MEAAAESIGPLAVKRTVREVRVNTIITIVVKESQMFRQKPWRENLIIRQMDTKNIENN